MTSRCNPRLTTKNILDDDEESEIGSESSEEPDLAIPDFRDGEETDDSDCDDDDYNPANENLTILDVPAQITGKNGYQWSGQRSTNRRIPRRNIMVQLPGNKAPAKNITDELKMWELFFPDELVDAAVIFTNQKIKEKLEKREKAEQDKQKGKKKTPEKKVKRQSYENETTATELRALFGLFYLAGALHQNRMDTRDMFSLNRGVPLFRATMSENRFVFLTSSLRFDDIKEREEKRKTDKLVPVRRMFDHVVNTSQRLYTPSAMLTIDEQLLGFKGRCNFKIYIPNKPDKSGIKIVMLCDAKTGYMLNGEVYLGKNETETQNRGLAERYLLTLTTPIYNLNRTLTSDNWFTSIPSAEKLLEKGITTVGTLRSNKDFAECATKASHFLRHHQHTVGTVPWKSRDELLDTFTNKTDLMVRQREDANIICELTNSSGISKDKLRWFHNGLEIDFGHRYTKDTRTGHITIVNVHFEDGGLWHCQDRDSGVVGNPVHVIVLEEPKPPYLLIDGRRLDPGNLFVPIKENNDLSVECIVEGGNPKPQLNWLLVPSSNNADVNSGVVTVPGLLISNESSTSENAAVHLFRSEAKLPKVLRAHHNSTIICLVNHVTLQNPINTSVLLDVQYTPSFGISRVPGFGFPITEGISVSLKCDVDSNPVSNPIWQKDNDVPPTEQSNDGYLNFTSIRIEDSGWYKCITRYQLAEYSSIGYFLNVREARNQAIEEETPEELAEEGSALEVTLGGEVQLECPAGSVSCWGRSKYPGQHLEPLGPGPKLTLGNVVYQEAGEYKCFVGRNSKMEKWRSRSVQVNVVGSPIVYPANKTITAVINQRVTFSLEFCANPPVTKAFWVRQSKSLTPGIIIDGLMAHNVSESNTKHCQKAELTINSVQVEDNGEYMFVVASERGLAGATIMLNVTVITALSEDSLVKETHSGTSGQQYYSKFTMHFVVAFYSFILIVFLH